MQNDGYFNISGIIDGQIKTLVTLECLKSGENNSTITLEKSDHYVYYVQWKRVYAPLFCLILIVEQSTVEIKYSQLQIPTEWIS